MEELKNKIDNQIEKLKKMILKNESKDEISNQKKELDRLLEEYIEKLK